MRKETKKTHRKLCEIKMIRVDERKEKKPFKCARQKKKKEEEGKLEKNKIKKSL